MKLFKLLTLGALLVMSTLQHLNAATATLTTGGAATNNMVPQRALFLNYITIANPGTTPAIVTFFDNKYTNYVTTNAAYTAQAYVTTNATVIFTNISGVLTTNTVAGIHTYSFTAPAATNNSPIVAGPFVVGTNSTFFFAPNVVANQGLAVTNTANVSITVQYNPLY